MDFFKTYSKGLKKIKKANLKKISSIFFWFMTGAILASFFLLGFSYLLFQKTYQNVVYPGVTVDGVNFSQKSGDFVKKYYDKKNEEIKDTKLVFSFENNVATVSAQDIDLGYDSDLLAIQSLSIGRTGDAFTNISLIVQAYFSGINLEPSYTYTESKLAEKLSSIVAKINTKPQNAVFEFKDNRVTAFKPSLNGRDVDVEKTNDLITQKQKAIVKLGKPQILTFTVPIKIIEPEITTDKANNLGIKELIGVGTSLFAGSIESRIYNINLATSRINGALIKPDEVFSFNEVLGDISAFTGYKQAYVIQNGRTVLGDGGGVCQVSTTFFRAILNAGLPIIERTAHAYRVSYYEQDSPPGLDATIYVPTVDLKFKNDTGSYILVQAVVDNANQRLTFYFYGKKDGRVVNMSSPVITSQVPPPEAKYEDDPTLPTGQVKQVDFAAWGANVYFTREVIKDGKKIISERFNSNYRPWQAVFLRGTKP